VQYLAHSASFQAGKKSAPSNSGIKHQRTRNRSASARLIDAVGASRHLHEKVDHLISKQWQRLAEIQELQIELMQEQRYPGAAD
jgi:hypothetical protein